METELRGAYCSGTRYAISEDGEEIAHAYLFILSNDAHARTFGYIEDVFVDQKHRGKDLGHALMTQLITLAREAGCYKIVLSSRDGRGRLHAWYGKLGFAKHGSSFRMDL